MLITLITDGCGRLIWPARVRYVVGCVLLLFSADDLLAQDQSHRYAASEPSPTLVVGFVGGFVRSTDLRHSEVQMARHLRAEYGDTVDVVFKNREGAAQHALQPEGIPQTL